MCLLFDDDEGFRRGPTGYSSDEEEPNQGRKDQGRRVCDPARTRRQYHLTELRLPTQRSTELRKVPRAEWIHCRTKHLRCPESEVVQVGFRIAKEDAHEQSDFE